MAARTKARKRAVDVLYEADVRGRDRLAVLRDRIETANPPVPVAHLGLVQDVHSALARLGPGGHRQAPRLS